MDDARPFAQNANREAKFACTHDSGVFHPCQERREPAAGTPYFLRILDETPTTRYPFCEK